MFVYEELVPEKKNYYTPLPINWISKAQQATLHDTDFNQKNLRASRASGKVMRLFAHTCPLQNPDPVANPLHKLPRRATQVGGIHPPPKKKLF